MINLDNSVKSPYFIPMDSGGNNFVKHGMNIFSTVFNTVVNYFSNEEPNGDNGSNNSNNETKLPIISSFKVELENNRIGTNKLIIQDAVVRFSWRK